MEELGLGEGIGDLVAECREGQDVWLHVPARSSLRVMLLRERPVFYWQHFTASGPVFCESKRDRNGALVDASACPLCRGEIGAKKKYVYTVSDMARGSGHLLDVSPATALDIESTVNQTGVALGMVFDLRKEGGVSNGRIRAKWSGTFINEKELPEGPDVLHVFRKMRLEQRSTDIWKACAQRRAERV